MICELCNGKGWVQGQAPDIPTACSACDGKGFVDMTNEEYIKSLNTEQLAEKLTDFSFWLVPNYPTEDKREQIRKRIVEWLKQPHTDKE